jgi:hypothetical protein
VGVTRRRALDIEQNLVDWARPHLGDKRRLYRIMDTKLGGQHPKKGVNAIASISFASTRMRGLDSIFTRYAIAHVDQPQ